MPVYLVSYSVLDDSHKAEVSNFFNNGLNGIGKENMFPLKEDQWVIIYSGPEQGLMKNFEHMQDYLEVFTIEVFKGHVMFFAQKERHEDYRKWLLDNFQIRNVKHIKSPECTLY